MNDTLDYLGSIWYPSELLRRPLSPKPVSWLGFCFDISYRKTALDILLIHCIMYLKFTYLNYMYVATFPMCQSNFRLISPLEYIPEHLLQNSTLYVRTYLL